MNDRKDNYPQALYDDALAWSRHKGWRVGRKWLVERGATKKEAYLIMLDLDLAGVPPRWPDKEPLLSDEARMYLGQELYEEVRVRKMGGAPAEPVTSARKSAPAEIVAHEPQPMMPVEIAAGPLAQVSMMLQEYSGAQNVDLSPVATEVLVTNSVTLGRFVSEANVVLGAMLVELEARFDQAPDELHDMGHASFKSFVQEKIAVGYDTAIKLMQIVKVYHREGGVALPVLLETPYTKLYAGINLARQDPEAALTNAQTRTLREIEQIDPFESMPASPTAARDPLVYLDAQRYPQTIVELFDAARDRLASVGRMAEYRVTPARVLEVMAMLVIGATDEVLRGEWDGVEKIGKAV